MTIRVFEQPLPGVGRRYDLPTRDGRRLTIVKLDAGGCELSLHTGDRDDPDASLSLDHRQALTVAAILTGADFSIEPVQGEPRPGSPGVP